MSIADVDVKIDEKIQIKITEPKKYKVLLLNDDHTPIDFVIELIMVVFKHTHDTAKDLTLRVHNEGSAIVGVYSYEIAEQKGLEATQLARQSGFPLQVKVDQE
jgi:ATP-dependent Clp protease adaptor protein ClpS